MRRLSIFLILALLAALPRAPVLAADSTPGSWRWTYQLGELLSPGTDYMSCAYVRGKGYFAGAYTEGEAVVAFSADGAGWDGRFAWHPDRTESVSSFLHPVGQVHALTESPEGPAFYLVPEAGGRMQQLTRFEGGLLYAFAGPGARERDTACLASGHQRDVPGFLARWDGSGYVRDSVDMRDELGRPLLPWDVGEVAGRRVAVCALSWDYNAPDAGRILVESPGGGWEVSGYRGPGVIQARTYDAYPGVLFVSNTRGEVWSSRDGYKWSLHWRGDGEAYLLEVAGRPLVVTGRGSLFEDWSPAPALTIPDVRHISLAADPDNWILAGPVTMSGDDGSRTILIRREEMP